MGRTAAQSCLLHTQLPWKAALFLIGLAALVAVSGGERSVYDWMPYDAFDEIDDRYRAVTAQNCKSRPASELRLPVGSVGQLPQFNRLLSYIVYPNRTKLMHVHNMALNRAFFYRCVHACCYTFYLFYLWWWPGFVVSREGTAAAAPPPFRPGKPALCGSRPLVAPYYYRLGDLLCLTG